MVTIREDERQRMMQARSIGPRMVAYLEEIGISRLSELRGADPGELAMRINIALGKRHINRMGVEAMANLVALADREAAERGE